jgi:hypothetical protein
VQWGAPQLVGAPAQVALVLVLASRQLRLLQPPQQPLPAPGLLLPLLHRLPESLLWLAVQVAANLQAAGA